LNDGRVTAIYASAVKPSPSTLKVVFAEDNYLVREGTYALLKEVEGVELVELVADYDALIEAVNRQGPPLIPTYAHHPPPFRATTNPRGDRVGGSG